MATSSPCVQSCMPHPKLVQLTIEVSVPLHATSSSPMGIVPGPYSWPNVCPIRLQRLLQYQLRSTHTGLSNTSAYRPISHTPLSAPVSPLTLLQTSLVWDTISSEIVLNRLSHGMVTNASAYKPIGGYQPMGQES